MLKGKKFISSIITVTLIFSMIVPVCASEGINVVYHSQKEILDYLKSNGVDRNAETSYKVKASVKSPYVAGTLTDSSYNSALKLLNAVRYVAGIDANVTINEEYNQLAQAAALVNAANNALSHYPEQPSGMDDSLYQLGSTGASQTNIGWMSWKGNLGYSILNGWMDDGDSSNISVVGHRRWILNPTMKQTGFGWVNTTTGTYTAMYAFDGVFEPTDYYGVAWPAQNMPIEYFEDDYPWSISMGMDIDVSKVQVVLTRKKDKKTWKFSKKSADGYFNVNNDNYGQAGCIIFRPNNITYSNGDSFNVSITGLEKNVSYDVNFFMTEECTHQYGNYTVTKKATLKKNGIEKSVCSNCGKVKERTIYKASKIKLKKKTLKYNGKVRKPTVIVKNSKGKTIPKKYYKVTYSKKSKKVGTYKVKVKLKGIYKGTKTLKFKIKK